MAIERYNGERITGEFYAPLLPTILGIFTVRERYFEFATMFMILVVTPLIIVLITRTWLGAFFYFTTSSYLFFMTAGLFAQSLLTIFLLGLFATKNNYIRLGLVVLGSISHSFGPLAMIVTIIIILIHEQKIVSGIGSFFPASFCSPVWGTSLPTALSTKVSGVGTTAEAMSLNDVGSFFTKMAPFPFLFISIKGFVDRKEHDYLLLFFLSLLGAYFVNVRILLFAAIICVIGFTKTYPSLQHKKLWIILAIGNGILLFSQHHILTNKLFCP